MDDSVGSSLASEGLTYLLICGRRSLVSGTKNDIVVSWITLWGMIKIYWLDLTLAYILDHAVCCAFCRKFGPKPPSHYKLVRKRSIVRSTVRTMFGELKVRLSSIKKRSIVRRNVRSMFDELTVRPVKNGLWFMLAGLSVSPGMSRQWSIWSTQLKSTRLFQSSDFAFLFSPPPIQAVA